MASQVCEGGKGGEVGGRNIGAEASSIPAINSEVPLGIVHAGLSTDIAVVGDHTCGDTDDEQDDLFHTFLELRRAERRKIQGDNETQRCNTRKQPTLSREPKHLALPLHGRVAPSRPARSGRPPMTATQFATSSWGMQLDRSIDQARRWQERNETCHAEVDVQSCLGADRVVRGDCVPAFLRIGERAQRISERSEILQALENTASQPCRLMRFVELGGAVVLGRWLSEMSSGPPPSKLSRASCAGGTGGPRAEGRHEAELQELACSCLHVISILQLKPEEARSSGVLEACETLDMSCPRAQNLASMLIDGWSVSSAELLQSQASISQGTVQESEVSVRPLRSQRLSELEHRSKARRHRCKQIEQAEDVDSETASPDTLEEITRLGHKSHCTPRRVGFIPSSSSPSSEGHSLESCVSQLGGDLAGLDEEMHAKVAAFQEQLAFLRERSLVGGQVDYADDVKKASSDFEDKQSPGSTCESGPSLQAHEMQLVEADLCRGGTAKAPGMQSPSKVADIKEEGRVAYLDQKHGNEDSMDMCGPVEWIVESNQWDGYFPDPALFVQSLVL